MLGYIVSAVAAYLLGSLSFGIIFSKLKYKKDFDFTAEMQDELFQCAVISARLDAKMDAIRKKVYENNDKK